MEYINKIELQGIVGNVREQVVMAMTVQSFSLVTEQLTKYGNGAVINESTWHNIVAWESEKVQKGDAVRVVGRLRQQRYISAAGEEKLYYEVIASELKVIRE